jgi:hypothetical protein
MGVGIGISPKLMYGTIGGLGARLGVDTTTGTRAGDPPATAHSLWPLPEPSTFMILPDTMFRLKAGNLVSFDVVSRELEGVLRQARRTDYRYFKVQDGLIVVVRRERTDDAGNALPIERRYRDMDDPQPRGIFEYLEQAIFGKPTLFYRVIVFVISTREQVNRSALAKERDFHEILPTGYKTIPQELSGATLDSRHVVATYVYEYVRNRRADRPTLRAGHLSAAEHLQRAGMAALLRNQP